MSQKYEKLKTLLKELFQLDQPDLDFGLYRVMHAKSAEVSQFLDKDLLPQVQAAFSQYRTADKAEIEKELAKVIAGIEAAGMDPVQSPKADALRGSMDAAEYKHVVLGLIFLKYISDVFEEKHAKAGSVLFLCFFCREAAYLSKASKPTQKAARNYWKVLKNRLKKEGSQPVTNCNRLKLVAEDGRMRVTAVADPETLLRIIQSVPSPKAEPIKLWLAKVGYERIQDMSDPARSLDRARNYWQPQGRSEKWIQQRMMGQETRNKLTEEDAKPWQRTSTKSLWQQCSCCCPQPTYSCKA